MNDMDAPKRKLDTGGVFAGLMLIAIGTLFLLDHMGIADLHDVLHSYWPMFLVIFGATRFLHRRAAWSGVWLIIIGLWLQVTTLHLWGVSFNSSWPLLLIAMGALMVIRALFRALGGNVTEANDERQ
jgi:hypothetical protein